jgi:hypothetical protein
MLVVAVIAVSFGLPHGFGFAAVLRDIGLPQTELPTALLFFNIGVEFGQILFVLTLLARYYLLRPAFIRLLRSARDHEVQSRPASAEYFHRRSKT